MIVLYTWFPRHLIQIKNVHLLLYILYNIVVLNRGPCVRLVYAKYVILVK